METDALWKPRKKQTTFFPPFPQGLENLPQNVKFPTVPQPTANSIKPMKSSNSKRSDHVLVGPTVALPTRIRVWKIELLRRDGQLPTDPAAGLKSAKSPAGCIAATVDCRMFRVSSCRRKLGAMAAESISGVFRLRRLWLVIAAATLVPAFLSIFTSYINAKVVGRPGDWRLVVFAACLWLTFGVLTPVIYFLAGRFPLKRERIARTALAHMIGALGLCLSWTSLSIFLAVFLVRNPNREPFARYYTSWILTNLPWSVFLYFSVLGCVFAFSYYREAREREAQQARLATQLAEARLGALRMQLNPHFLFNSLNAITVLVRDQNTRDAAHMLELLSAILRQVLKSDKRHEVPLDKELQFTERYLAIEQVRFSDRLRVNWSIDPSIRDAMVPEFILQPLVENAVRHGVANQADAGVIEVTAVRSDGHLVLSVKDDGPGYYPTSESGVGLTNTRARLETLFGEAGSLEILNAPAGGAVATVRLPFRTETIG